MTEYGLANTFIEFLIQNYPQINININFYHI